VSAAKAADTGEAASARRHRNEAMGRKRFDVKIIGKSP
jgi:hypothetical protein